ncbi:MAG: hypothetical protein NT089_00070 [Planctomycetia bacterium]|nr:hypothetical protein [Planctomycetia bacterium]
MLTLSILLAPSLDLGEWVLVDYMAVFRVLEELPTTFDLTRHSGGCVLADEPLTVVLGVAGMDGLEKPLLPEIFHQKALRRRIVTDSIWLQLRPACDVFLDVAS